METTRSQRITNWTQSVSRLLFIALVVYLLIRLFGTGRSGIASAIFNSTLAILIAVVPLAVTNYQQRKRELQARQRELNIKTYDAFANFIYDDILRPILDAAEKGQTHEPTLQEIQKRQTKMRDFAKSVTLWGGDGVVIALSEFRTTLIESKKPGWTDTEKRAWGDIALHGTARLFLALRKDLGYDNKGVTPHHLWSFFGIGSYRCPSGTSSKANQTDWRGYDAVTVTIDRRTSDDDRAGSLRLDAFYFLV